MDEVSSLHRLYLTCDAERDAAVKELDVALANLAASEETRRRLTEQVFVLTEQVQALTLQLAAAHER
jgi:hypothetical protein